eukprot:4352587-Prymnesium_polylepis.2
MDWTAQSHWTVRLDWTDCPRARLDCPRRCAGTAPSRPPSMPITAQTPLSTVPCRARPSGHMGDAPELGPEDSRK